MKALKIIAVVLLILGSIYFIFKDKIDKILGLKKSANGDFSNESVANLVPVDDKTYVFDNPPYSKYEWNLKENKCLALGTIWVNDEECKARGLGKNK